MAIAVKSTTVTKTMALMKVFEMMMTVIVVPIIIIIVGRRDEYTKHPKQTQKRSGEPPQENPNPQGGGGGDGRTGIISQHAVYVYDRTLDFFNKLRP